MYNPKISVIIPVYNAEKTIGAILGKLISQSYQNIEVIAVNDGSKDSSWDVLQQFAKKDRRIVAINQQNSGASSARNVGIKNATGEFIMFIDSDDDINDKLISELTSHIKSGSDFIMCGMSINGNEIIAPNVFIDDKKVITKYVLKSLLTKNLLYGPCCKLFRRSIVVKNKIQFPEDVKYGEDTIFVLNYLRHANSITSIQQSLYSYNLQASGLASSNAANAKFRHARTEALKKYLNDKSSVSNLFMYLMLRLRWMMSAIKSRRIIRASRKNHGKA